MIVGDALALLKLGEEAFASQQGLDKAYLIGLGQRVGDIVANARVGAKVLVQKLARFLAAHFGAAAQAKLADAIDGGEVDGLAQSTLIAVNLVEGHVEELDAVTA